MTIKYFYYAFVTIAFLHKLIVMIKMKRRKKIDGEIHHKWITKYGYNLYILAFVLPLIEYIVIDRPINYYLSIACIILYILGWVLSYWARSSLANYWTTEIEIRDEHPLIKQGPYKYLRHPHYLFLFIELYCLPLIPNAYYSVIVISLTVVPFIILRVIYEEKEMIKKFGDKYKQYTKEVWLLFPIPIFKSGVKEPNAE